MFNFEYSNNVKDSGYSRHSVQFEANCMAKTFVLPLRVEIIRFQK